MKFPSTQNKIPKIPILMYHEVSDDTGRSKRTRHTNPAYSLSVEQFREQMEYIHDNGYKTRTLNELLDTKSHTQQKSVVLTFDDGWQNNYTNAFPILVEFGLTATIFVITDFIGKPNYMDWDQLREMNTQGISIQSHTASHRPLAGLATSEIKDELEESKCTIEHHLGTPVDFLSAPHGIIDQKVIDIARSLGYKAICTSEPGFSHSNGNPAILKRINISESYNKATFARILEGNQLSIFPARISKKTKNLTRKLVGYSNYRKLYNLRYRIRAN